MTAQNNLEIKGNLQTHSFAELLLETSEAKLTGSLRLAFETGKIVVYLKDGKVVFAASNARRHRLFEMLLGENKISRNQLTEIPNFTSDLELAANLKSKNLFSEAEISQIISTQIEEILKTVFAWTAGEWIFSPQTRVKEEIQFEVNTPELLLEYARNLSVEAISKYFKNPRETFAVKPSAPANVNLLPTEAFVLSRFDKSFITVSDIKTVSGLPDAATLQILYVLWLGGFLFRQNWQAAFSERKISEILSAKLSLKKDFEEVSERVVEEKIASPKIKPSAVETARNNIKPDEISLDDYLARVEKAQNYYEVLNVSDDAELKEIKPRYFALAKQFHPDMFHQEKDFALLQRIQSAFTRTAQAYETLKDAESRKVYDYKLNKNPVGQKSKDNFESSAENSGNSPDEFAKETFEQGFTLLMEDEYEEAAPFLARAVQLAPDNAKYHAYYGKALSNDESQRYKADAELQIAIRLEPRNITYRLVSAEFYIRYGLFKRAEGEINRLLSISPNNAEALALLDSLPKK